MVLQTYLQGDKKVSSEIVEGKKRHTGGYLYDALGGILRSCLIVIAVLLFVVVKFLPYTLGFVFAYLALKLAKRKKEQRTLYDVHI